MLALGPQHAGGSLYASWVTTSGGTGEGLTNMRDRAAGTASAAREQAAPVGLLKRLALPGSQVGPDR